jgi:CheY-like chemotaxis protein
MLTPEDRGRLDHYRAFGVSRYLIKPLRRRSLAEQLGFVLTGKAPVEAQAAHTASSDDRLAPLSLSGLHVLMADDNPVNALLARTVLTRAGANVTVAADGEEAVSAFQRAGPFDLVLLDLRMPRLDGLGAARRIRALSPEGARVPLIALTAETSADDRAAALAAGMNDFVTKPIAPAALAALAGRYLGTRFAQSA